MPGYRSTIGSITCGNVTCSIEMVATGKAVALGLPAPSYNESSLSTTAGVVIFRSFCLTNLIY